MGYIRETKLKKGGVRYQAEVRLKGHPTLTATFDRRTDAKAWVQKLETEKLKAYIAKNPDSYLREIAGEFKVTIAAAFYACKRLKITLKKRHPSTRNETRIKERNSKRS